MKLNNYYNELPENFKEVYVIDAKNKKTSILFVIYSLILTILAFFVTYFITHLVKPIKIEVIDNKFFIAYFVFLISMFLYIVLHELTHGLVYYIMTKQKLTYGFTLTVAFCGVPHIYVNKKTALLAVLAPFVVYTIVFITLIILLQNSFYVLLAIILFAIHFGGCIGDLWCTWILLFKIKESCLMNDTGPKQTFYIEEK